MPKSMESSSNTLELGRSDNQLVTKKRKRFGKAIFVGAIIGFLALVYVVYSVYRKESTLPEPQSQKLPSQITLATIMNGTFDPNRFNGTWVSDDEILMRDDGYIILYNVTSKKPTVIVNDAHIAAIADEITLSGDRKYLMVAFAMRRMYRHSTYSQYLVINIDTQKHTPVTNSRNEPLVLSLVKWAPKGNGFAYIYYNDIYYRPNATTHEEYRLTNNGNSSIYNGICDWVYEEEIFSDSNAMWFSPEGDKLAYASFNDENVDVMSIPFYGDPGSLESQYTKMYNVRYPKPGRPNPTVRLNIVDLTNPKKTSQEVAFSHLFQEPIVSSVTWISNSELGIIVMNRIQNKAHILSCSVLNVPCEKILYLESKTGWLILFTPPLFSDDGQRMVFIHPSDQANNAGPYRHLTLHDRTTNITRALTSGKFTVTDILAWDSVDDYVYFHATLEDNPRARAVFRIKVAEDNISQMECLSCIKTDDGCSFATAIPSEKNSYFVETCGGPGVPVVSIYDKNYNKIMDWEDNKELNELLGNISLPEKQYIEVLVAPGMYAQVMLLLPPYMDKSGGTKYPLLVNVYGGPDSNQVLDRYKMAWETYLCVTSNVIIAYIDGRGSGLKGDRMLFANYRQLGSYEIEDQINVTRQLQVEFNYIDRKRTAIWGWSYGGYATGMALALDTANVFKCGVSVAPVTDWIYYDSMYTERFMGLPGKNDNYLGYKSSSLVHKARHLENKKFLLMHGTMDDNVHYQQSMMLARALEIDDILFRQQSYPDEAHSIGGVRHHLYHTLGAFLDECFS